jgi:ribosomal protein L11 methyltransferase
MKTLPLFQLTVCPATEQEAIVAEVFEMVTGQTPCVYTDAIVGTVRISTYYEGLGDAALGLLNDLTLALERSGITIPPELTPVRREDWAESWKKHFKPIRIGRRLLIKPSWSRVKTVPGQKVIVLDPGLSFGTGQHATTHFCLKQLVATRVSGKRQSLWDVGTGSGILAISAARLGYGPIWATDFDPVCIKVARKNANGNRIADRIRFQCLDLIKQPEGRGTYDLICANLMYDLLITERKKLVSRLKPEGRLVLAGILVRQFQAVQEVFETSGLKLVTSWSKGEWRSGSFIFCP